MALMTEAQARQVVEYAVLILNEYEKYLTECTTNTSPTAVKLQLSFQDHSDNLIEAAQKCEDIGGEPHHELEMGIHNALSSFRSGLVGVKAQAAALLAQPLRVLARWHGFIETDPTDIIAKLSEYYIESGRRIQKRGLTVNSPAKGHVNGTSNTGSGTVYTCSTDENGDPVDNLWPETVEFKCVSDEHSGAVEHNEVFSIEGEPAHATGLKITGSGSTSSTKALTPSDSILLNPSFTAYGSDAANPVFTNWTEGGSGVITADTSSYYRDSMGEAAPVSVKFASDATLTQAFSARKLQLNTNTPYYWHLAFLPSSGATGNLKVKIGAQDERTVAFNGGSGGNVWTVHHERFWFSQVNTESPNVVITVDSLSGGTLHIDDFIIAPMSSFNNLYYCIIGGQTPFLKEDRMTVQIDNGSTGLVNEWLWKAYNMYLPCEASPGTYTEGTTGSNPTSTTARDWKDPSGWA